MKVDLGSKEGFIGYLCLLTLAGVYLLVLIILKNKCTAFAIGRVESVEQKDRIPSHGGPEIILFISFVADGVVIQTEKSLPAGKACYEKGDEIKMMYDPRKPKRCYVEGYALRTIFR